MEKRRNWMNGAWLPFFKYLKKGIVMLDLTHVDDVHVHYELNIAIDRGQAKGSYIVDVIYSWAICAFRRH